MNHFAVLAALVLGAAHVLLWHSVRRRIDKQDELLGLHTRAISEATKVLGQHHERLRQIEGQTGAQRAHLAEHCQTMDGVIRTLQAQDEQIQALGREASARERKRPWLS